MANVVFLPHSFMADTTVSGVCPQIWGPSTPLMVHGDILSGGYISGKTMAPNANKSIFNNYYSGGSSVLGDYDNSRTIGNQALLSYFVDLFDFIDYLSSYDCGTIGIMTCSTESLTVYFPTIFDVEKFSKLMYNKSDLVRFHEADINAAIDKKNRISKEGLRARIDNNTVVIRPTTPEHIALAEVSWR